MYYTTPPNTASVLADDPAPGPTPHLPVLEALHLINQGSFLLVELGIGQHGLFQLLLHIMELVLHIQTHTTQDNTSTHKHI